MLAGVAGEGMLAGVAGVGGVSTEAGDSGLAGLIGLAGESGDAGVCAETGEAGVCAEGVDVGDGVAGDELDVGETMLSLSTVKSRSAELPSSSVTLVRPGTLRPLTFSMSGIALAMLAAPPAATPRLSAPAAPTAIQFLVSMIVSSLRASRAARRDVPTLRGDREITRRRR
jgi:hypothetical protein